MEGAQNKNRAPLRHKNAKFHNEGYKYKTKEFQELHDKLHQLKQGRKKL